MSGAGELARALVDALEAAAFAEAGARAGLASVEVAVLGDGAPASLSARITRRTKTLIFAHAAAAGADGATLAEASSVHRIKPGA